MDFNFSSGNLSMNGKLFSNVKKFLKLIYFKQKFHIIEKIG